LHVTVGERVVVDSVVLLLLFVLLVCVSLGNRRGRGLCVCDRWRTTRVERDGERTVRTLLTACPQLSGVLVDELLTIRRA
jgi:hypothetical protein